jgi:hypothetical protein
MKEVWPQAITETIELMEKLLAAGNSKHTYAVSIESKPVKTDRRYSVKVENK